MNQYPAEEERAVIRQIKETIARVTGKAPRGWLGPGGGDESPHTLDHLAAEGFDYVCDWGCDDQPVPMRVKSGRMIGMKTFGASAPLKELQRKFGFEPDHLVAAAKELVGK